MEWVETTGRTLEEAREAALDQLGVDEHDAEFEVLEQPRAGLFGRMRGEARVRARVRPTAPRAKEDRRDRRRRSRSGGNGGSGNGGNGGRSESSRTAATANPQSAPPTAGAEAGDTGESGAGAQAAAQAAAQPAGETAGASAGGTTSGSRRRRRSRSGKKPGQAASGAGAGSGGAPGAPGNGDAQAGGLQAGGPQASEPGASRRREPDESKTVNNQRRDGAEVEVPLQEQGRVAEDFLSGLITEFGLTAQVTLNEREEENLDLALSGSDLGLLIGQKGATLLAVQDLTRTVVQHKTGANNGRIHVDIGGYRQKRSEALSKFARDVAGRVKQSGQRTVLEPMNAADRKVVHDAITDIEGVATISEGEEPRRRVVVVPSE